MLKTNIQCRSCSVKIQNVLALVLTLRSPSEVVVSLDLKFRADYCCSESCADFQAMHWLSSPTLAVCTFESVPCTCTLMSCNALVHCPSDPAVALTLALHWSTAPPLRPAQGTRTGKLAARGRMEPSGRKAVTALRRQTGGAGVPPPSGALYNGTLLLWSLSCPSRPFLPHLFTPEWKWLSINDNPVEPSWLRGDKIFYLILHSLCCPGWKWHQILITKAKKLWKANKVFIETSPPYSALNANINWFPKLDRSGGKFSRYFTDCGFVLLGSHRPSNADLADTRRHLLLIEKQCNHGISRFMHWI